jgi:hypothetical protein
MTRDRLRDLLKGIPVPPCNCQWCRRQRGEGVPNPYVEKLKRAQQKGLDG